MRIKHIRLRAVTASRTFGTDVSMGKGLNVIRADNTSGKSTCLLGILYCLGFERSLGPNLRVPLPYAMRERIQLEKDGSEYDRVLQSYVMLEIENNRSEVVTIRRDIEGGRDRRLVRTWSGSTIHGYATATEEQDFFLHDPGAAVREDGFHTYLAKFLGLELPTVPRFDGTECPLYLETLWPLHFVEQKRGWSGIQGPFPTFFRIQELSRRVMEFLLRLDVAGVRRRQAELRKERRELEREWRDKRAELLKGIETAVRVNGLPLMPSAEFSRQAEVGVSAYHEGRWVAVGELGAEIQRRRKALDVVEPPSWEAAKVENEAQLKKHEERYAELVAQSALLGHDLQLVQTERLALEERLESLRIDLQRNLDAKKLEEFGSRIAGVISDKICPTCHQTVERDLLPEQDVVGMALDENIAFVRSQRDLYSSVQDKTVESLSSLGLRYESVQRELRDVRGAIRTLRSDLVQPSNGISRSDVEAIVRLDARIVQWRELQESIDESVDEMQNIAEEWVHVTEELSGMGTPDLSEDDRRKVLLLRDGTQKLLAAFGFLSFRPEEITLADDDFRPRVVKREEDGERVEKDIGFEVSASDGIRLKWAYYLSLLRVSQELSTHHLGTVVLDEPGQQQMKDVDLSAFLIHAAKMVARDGQIVVSTSEDIGRVRESLRGTTATIHDYDGFMIRQLE